MTDSHITTPAPQEEDLVADQTLRPTNFDEFVGQSDVVENLKLYIEASQKRGEALDHVLLFGPPGLGKTTLAHIISKELDVNLKQTSGPVMERAADWRGFLRISEAGMFFLLMKFTGSTMLWKSISIQPWRTTASIS